MCVAENQQKQKGGEPLVRKLFGRFIRNRDGATAIEVGILALPFLLLIFAILETCISFAAQQVMSNAMDDAARRIRTGQDLRPNITESYLKGEICERLSLIVSSDRCTNNLTIDLRNYASFKQAAGDNYKNDDGVITIESSTGSSNPKVDAGGASTINTMRVFYKWPVMTDLFRKYMENAGSGKTLLVSTVTWQNEPYGN